MQWILKLGSSGDLLLVLQEGETVCTEISELIFWTESLLWNWTGYLTNCARHHLRDDQ